MQKRIRHTQSAFAAVIAVGLFAPAAGAQVTTNLNLDEMAAALVVPVITGGHPGNAIKSTSGDVITPGQTAVTLATVTNGKNEAVQLAVDIVSGDPEDTWTSMSFECQLTARETTTFIFKPVDFEGDSAVFVECSDGSDTAAEEVMLFTGAQNGFMFVAVADPESGDLESENIIFGDAVVVDTDASQAYSFGAIAIQAGMMGQNNGDKEYHFDNSEYAEFPSVLATNFITPSSDVVAELILFTLDGTVGNPDVPLAQVRGYAYNDDEFRIDVSHQFRCFDIVALDQISASIVNRPGSPGLGTLSGHLELTPQPVTTRAGDTHDVLFGNGDGSRRRNVHGWIAQATTGTFVRSGQPTTNQLMDLSIGADQAAAWGRPLAQSTTALMPNTNGPNPDDLKPVFQADPTIGSNPPPQP